MSSSQDERFADESASTHMAVVASTCIVGYGDHEAPLSVGGDGAVRDGGWDLGIGGSG